MADKLELPTQELRDAAFRRFGETQETRTIKLAELRQLVQNIPYYNTINTSDEFLLRYLRGKAFQLDKAVKAIRCYIEFKQKHPEWMLNWTPQEFSAFKSVMHFLKARDKIGRVILLIHVKNVVKVFTKEFIEANPFGLIRFNLYCSELVSQNVEVQLYGMWVVPVCTGFKIRESRIFNQIAPFYERLAWHNYQIDCVPHEMAGYYTFDEPRYLRWYWNIAYNFITSPIRSRVFLCGNNYTRLHEIIDAENIPLLPSLFGGSTELLGANSKLLRSPTNNSRKSSAKVYASYDDNDIPEETTAPPSYEYFETQQFSLTAVAESNSGLSAVGENNKLSSSSRTLFSSSGSGRIMPL